MSHDETLRERVTRSGEETIGKLAQDLLDNPVVTGAISRAFETRERAMRVQEVAMSALNLPSAGDLERLTRRVRSVSQRLEAIEDGLERLEQRLRPAEGGDSVARRLDRIEAALAQLQATAQQAAPGAPPPTATGPTAAVPGPGTGSNPARPAAARRRRSPARPGSASA